MKKEVRVYLAPHEFETFLDSCDRRVGLASRIEARTSARRGIVVDLERRDFFIPDDPGVELAFVRLRETKDTTEGESALNGQARISWVPWSLYEDVQRYCDEEGIGPKDEIFDIGKDWLGKLVKQTAEDVAVATENPDYENIRTHDFRAYYATHMVRRLGVDKHIVMEMGGWDSEKAIKPYLASSLPGDLQDALVRAGAVEKDIEAPQRQDAIGEVLKHVRAIETALEIDTAVDNVNDLSMSEIQSLKQTVEESDEEPEEDTTEPSSLKRFMSVTSPIAVACYGAVISGRRSMKRMRKERLKMTADPVALSPAAGATVYSITLLVLFITTMIITGALASVDTAAVAIGAVIGSGRFDFNNSVESCRDTF